MVACKSKLRRNLPVTTSDSQPDKTFGWLWTELLQFNTSGSMANSGTFRYA